MPTTVIMPEALDAITDGRVIQWLKNEGDFIQPANAVCEVKMDGEQLFVFSPVEGYLLKILVGEEERALAGSILAWVGAQDEEWWDQTQPLQVEADEQPQLKRYRGFISPAVARLLQKHPVDLSRVKGTGEEGRITRNDLLAYLEEHDYLSGNNTDYSVSAAEEIQGENEVLPAEYDRIEVEGISRFGMLLREADLTRVDSHREQSLNNNLKLTYSVYFANAAMNALKRFPGCNVSWTPDGIIQFEEIMLGIVIQQDNNGYAVPTFKGLENLSLVGISRVLQALAAKARAKSLQATKPKPGTFTLLNHGKGGALWSFPAVQLPQASVLCFGAITPRAVAVNGEIEVRSMVYVSMAYDCLAISASLADRFLAHVVETLEQWE